MKLRQAMSTVVVASALLAGCGKKKEDGDKASASAVKEATPSKALTAEFFGTKPAPVGLLAKLPWGTPRAEVKTKMPEFFREEDKTKLLSDPTIKDVTYGIDFNKDTKTLDRMYVQLPKAAKATIESAWGPGKEGKDSIDRPRTYWFDAEGGWRAHLEQGFGEEVNVVFYRYQAAAKMLGEGPDGFGFASQPIVGATIEDLRANFKDSLVEETDEEAQKKQAEVSKFAGQDLEKKLGKASANARLELPPTEWEDFWTRVHFHWSDDGKVSTFWFKLPFEAYEPAKAELKAMFDKKWGTPKEAKEYGSTGDLIYIYRDKDPRITVKEDTISKGWDVKVSARAD